MKSHEVEVWGIAIDPFNQSPIVVLRKKENPKEVLPIWIGHPEASGIMMVLNNLEFERPLTYELLVNILNDLNAKVERVEISDLKEGTYYATIYLRDVLGNEHKIDARPSDAINLALRTGAPIFVADHVMESSKVVVGELPTFGENAENRTPEGEKGEETIAEDSEIKRFHEWLENLKPEDFQKFGKHGKEGN